MFLSNPRMNRLMLPMKCLSLAITLLAVAFVPAAMAHRQPTALTIIEFNPNTQITEVTHQLHAHEAAEILQRTAEHRSLPLESTEARARIALYAESKFAIINADSGEMLKLKLLGAQLDGESLFVFQEYEQKLEMPLKVRNAILQDRYPDQVNTVNFKTETGMVHTITFSKGDRVKTFKNSAL